ncbi:MAG: metalloregulator ArsR/SmtB family transcription factor [Zoogloeaceae bacterium]|nr:metalloregulator ArsR/SmtB family transcription factor [Zoogloeaceae bacterium]
MDARSAKDLLYEQVARVGKALSSPKRLELIELLAQGEKPVEQLAAELSIDMKLASAHLRALREARLATPRRDGKRIYYRLSGADVAGLGMKLREVAEEHLVELRIALQQIVETPDALQQLKRHELMEAARRGELVVIDVRPEAEYRAAHLPFARSIPLAELERRIAELPRDLDIVAYCRGPFCLLSDEAVKLLASRGFRVRKISDGITEWRAAGLPTEHARA